MGKWRWVALILLLLFTVLFPGCGGVATTLSGGSVPIGGRAITGTALLPTATPAANAQVAVVALPSYTTLRTGTTDTTGRFNISNVPTNQDILFLVTQTSGTQLQVVVPRYALAANPDQPLDIGNITAITTLVAAAIRLEQSRGPEDAEGIPGSQHAHLDDLAHNQNYSIETQQQMIGDPNSLNAQALTLLVPTANTELQALSTTPTTNTASTALDGLLAYMRCAHSQDLHFSTTLRTTLINAQLANKQYTPDAIAAALQFAGVSRPTAAQVSAASQRERTELTALNAFGSGITAFEALVIAGDVRTNGGFQLSSNALTNFLNRLLN